MGGFVSKADISEEQLRRHADGVKECLRSHEGDVLAIQKAISAQQDSVKILIQTVSALQDKAPVPRGQGHSLLHEAPVPRGQRDSLLHEAPVPRGQRDLLLHEAPVPRGQRDSLLHEDTIETAKNLLQNIQEIKEHQCSTLSGSYKVLYNCIVDALDYLIPGSGTSVDTKKSKDIPGKVLKPDDSSNYMLSLQNENKKLLKTIKDIGQECERLKLEKNGLKQENDNIHQTVNSQTEELRKFRYQKEELDRKNNEVRSLEQKLGNLEWQSKNRQRTVDELEREVWGLKEEKRKMKERKISVPIQLYYQRRGELMYMVADELCAMLNTQMQTKNINLDIRRCENIASLQSDMPTLVLCINASRLGTDAATAIEGIQRSGRTALLIFHHKNIHALPNQPSERMLTSAEFKALGGIFDLAFLNGKGIYACDMNNVALSGIETFIKQNEGSAQNSQTASFSSR